MLARLNDTGQELKDTDWHVDTLYEGLLLEAGMVKANFHRYVIDANRGLKGVVCIPVKILPRYAL